MLSSSLILISYGLPKFQLSKLQNILAHFLKHIENHVFLSNFSTGSLVHCSIHFRNALLIFKTLHRLSPTTTSFFFVFLHNLTTGGSSTFSFPTSLPLPSAQFASVFFSVLLHSLTTFSSNTFSPVVPVFIKLLCCISAPL